MFDDQPRFAFLVLVLAGCFCLGVTAQGRAQQVAATLDSTASVIRYTGSATLHDWTGTSRSASGTFVIDLGTPESSRAFVQVPVASFDSGIGARDKNMREVTEAGQYPTVSVRTTEIRPTHWGRSDDGYAGRWNVTCDLTFHGQTHPVDATVSVAVTDDSVRTRTQFPVSLTRFGVDRPDIVWGVAPVDDTIRIDARIAGAIQERPNALERLDTTRNKVTGTRRISSTDLYTLPTFEYAGTRAGLHAEARMPPSEQRQWIVALYGFADQPTGLANTQEIVLRADRQSVEPLRTTGSLQKLDDGTTVEITRMYFTRSAFETLADALTVSGTVGPARFSMPWQARHDLRLILQEVTASSAQPVSANEEE